MAYHRGSDYSQEDQFNIIAAWDAGESATYIANEVLSGRRTRSAVLGWINRNRDRLTRKPQAKRPTSNKIEPTPRTTERIQEAIDFNRGNDDPFADVVVRVLEGVLIERSSPQKDQ